jgi:hypothetical protein
MSDDLRSLRLEKMTSLLTEKMHCAQSLSRHAKEIAKGNQSLCTLEIRFKNLSRVQRGEGEHAL